MNTQIIDKLGDLSSHAVMVLKNKLDENDLKAALFVISRFVSAERLITLESAHPEAIATALAEGSLSPGEASKAASALSAVISASEVVALRERLDTLEAEITASKDRKL